MVDILNTFYGGLLKGIKLLLTVLVTALCIVVFGNVISRYFLHFALAWSDEAARFLFIWVTFLGAILANAKNEHMNLDIVIQKVPAKLGKTILILANIVVLVILAFVLKGGTTITIENLEWMSPAMEISYGMVFSIVPISCVILMLQTLAKLYGIIKSFKTSDSVGGA